jgi:hypothetical protein
MLDPVPMLGLLFGVLGLGLAAAAGAAWRAALVDAGRGAAPPLMRNPTGGAPIPYAHPLSGAMHDADYQRTHHLTTASGADPPDGGRCEPLSQWHAQN